MAAGWAWRLLALLVGALGAAEGKATQECPAGKACASPSAASGGKYHWPGPHGRPENYGNSPHVAPFDLKSSLKWTWHHPDGVWADIPLGVAIDDKSNVFVSGDRGVYKLSPEGKLLWRWHPPSKGQIPNGPALEDGRLFIGDQLGYFWALDMESGTQLWETRAAQVGCMDTSHLAARKGIVVAETEGEGSNMRNRCTTVVGLNASTGQVLWRFKPDMPIENLMVQFDGEDTFFFQDRWGKAYRNFLVNGSNIWKNGGVPDSFIAGTQMLGPNGVVYAVSVNASYGRDNHGEVNAYKAATGEWLWRQRTPRPPNAPLVVGKIAGDGRLYVLVPTGEFLSGKSVAELAWRHFPLLHRLPMFLRNAAYFAMHWFSYYIGDRQAGLWGLDPIPTALMALDAETGDVRWHWHGPTYPRHQCPGDERWHLKRARNGMRPANSPTPWSAPRVGGDGTIYIGSQSGHFFAIKDKDGNGAIDPGEVHDFDCGAEFSNAGSAHAPGLLVVASGERVFAFGF